MNKKGLFNKALTMYEYIIVVYNCYHTVLFNKIVKIVGAECLFMVPEVDGPSDNGRGLVAGLGTSLVRVGGVTECRVAVHVDIAVALWELEGIEHEPCFVGTLGQDGGVLVYNTSEIQRPKY